MNAKEARIQIYFHCSTCMEEITEEKRKAVLAGKEMIHTKERLAVGWTKEGLQVVCETCGKNVIDLDFMGQKVGTYEEDDNQTSSNKDNE